MISGHDFLRSGRRILFERYNFLWLFLSASLLTLSLPPYDLNLLAWVALVPLIVILENRSVLESFWIGFIWGVILWLFTAYWSFVYHFIALPGVVGSMALYSALFSAMYSYVQKKINWSKLIVFPVIWLVVEHFRSIGIYAFPWNVIGYSQHNNLPLIQVASFGGVWIISYLIVFFNVSIAECWQKKGQGLAKFVPMAVLLILVTLFYWGKQQIPPLTKPNGPKISLIQANFPIDMKFRPENIDKLIEQTRKLKSQEPQLVVWTETAILNYILAEEEARNKLFDLAAELKTSLLVGAPNYELGDNDDVVYYNSAFLINPNREIAGVYNKIHLVPFGEFLPFARQFKFMEKLEEMVNSGGFTAGKDYHIFHLNGQSFGTLVCFEGVFDSLVRHFVNQGAGFMVNITNDGWSKAVASHYQHLAFAVFRAIENRIYFVRAGNTGVSAFIDPFGRFYEKSGTYSQATITNRIGEAGDKTFYTRYGNLFVYFIWFCFTVIVTISFKTRANVKSL